MRKKWAKNRENYPAENSTKECGVGDNCMVSKVTWVRELLWLQFLSQLVLIEQSLSLNVITHHHIIKWLCLAYNLHKFNTIHQHPIQACNIWSEAQHAINDLVLHLVCRAIRLLRLFPFQKNNKIKNSSAYAVMDVVRTMYVFQGKWPNFVEYCANTVCVMIYITEMQKVNQIEAVVSILGWKPI